MTPPEDAARFFDAIAHRYDRVYAPGRDDTRRSLARVLAELPERARVLDLGVGTGRELPALLDAGHAPVGLDASAEMLAICARRGRPVPLFRGDLWARLPWDHASFDAVIALHGTLSHPPSIDARTSFPHEVARVLRPGGVFIAEVPTAAWFENASGREDSRVQHVGRGHGRFTDEATGATVDAWFLDEAGWRALFAAALTTRIDLIGPDEALIVGRRG